MAGRKEWREEGDGERKGKRKESDKEEAAAEEREMQKSQDLILSKPHCLDSQFDKNSNKIPIPPISCKNRPHRIAQRNGGGGTDLLTSCFHVNGLLTPTEEEFCIALVGEKSVILMVLHISKEFVSLLTPLPTGDRNPA